MAVEAFARVMTPSWTERWSARLTRLSYHGEDVLLIKPQTFMNLSGSAVAEVLRFYRVPVGDLLLVHDDADLPLGRVLVRADGGHGGHKGVQSVIAEVGSADFARLRVGIGRPANRESADLTEHVLSEFREEERPLLDAALSQAVIGIGEWVIGGVPRAQNRVNRRDHPSRKPSCPERADSPGPLDRKEVE